MDDDGLDIPEIFRRPRETPEQIKKRREFSRALFGPERQIKNPRDASGRDYLPKTMTPEAKAILREERKAREAAKVARLKALKDRKR